jgi:DNA-binding response OmpR family regulator
MGNGSNERKTNATEEQGSRILIIDDEEVIHVSLRRILGRQGHQVDAELSALDALKRLERESYDLVITDLMMPDMNGIQLLERLQEIGVGVPVLMITGYPSIRTAVQALRLGAVDYLAKPYTRQELLAPVNRVLRGGAVEEAAPPKPAAGSGGEDEGIQEPSVQLEPGDRYFLRKHSWALYQQDGTVQVGIEKAFLDGIGAITAAELPEEADMVEQGYTGIRLKTVDNEDHGVFMPLSGQVMAVNEQVAADPGSIGPKTWLVQLLPVNLETELSMLLRA